MTTGRVRNARPSSMWDKGICRAVMELAGCGGRGGPTSGHCVWDVRVRVRTLLTIPQDRILKTLVFVMPLGGRRACGAIMS